MSCSEVKAKCMKAMNEARRVGTDDEAIQHGKNFYKFTVDHHPDLSVYFKGQRILLAIRIVINMYDDPETLRAYAREMAFFTVFVNSLKEHITIDEGTEKFFLQIGKEFSDECLKHTIALNLPN